MLGGFGFENKTDNDQSFEAGVSIDLESVENPLFNKEIKALLQTALESMANKDEEGYRSVFGSKQSADAHMYLFGYGYHFDYLGTIEEDNSGRIVIEIRGKVKDEEGIRDTPNGYFYFIKNKEGHWILGTID